MSGCAFCFEHGSYNCPSHGPHPDVKHKIAMLEAKVEQLERKVERLISAEKARML